MFKLFDTLTRQKADINAVNGNTINLYSCGPTVYDKAHIGNLRSFIFADTLRLALENSGVNVNWVMNITDVDDKTIKKAIAKYGPGATPAQLLELTDGYYADFIADLQKLNIDTNKIKIIKVSDVIKEIQDFVVELISLGYGYEAEDGSVYFSIEKYQKDFGDYGLLAGEKFMEGKRVNARIKNDEYDKDSLSDFALWKKHDEADGQIFWTHDKLAPGRPGWHIECSAINRIGFSGEPTDIHTGGTDLIFPHHTNEIAQSQPIAIPFVRRWAHNTFLTVDGKKMSKSLGNLFTLAEVEEKGFHPLAFKYLCLNSHYRGQMNFTWQSLQASEAGLEKLYSKLGSASADLLTPLQDDLNTPEALANLHSQGTDKKSLLALGLPAENPFKQGPIEIPEFITELSSERTKAKQDKNFALADELRKQIEDLGFTINDTPSGPEIVKK